MKVGEEELGWYSIVYVWELYPSVYTKVQEWVYINSHPLINELTTLYNKLRLKLTCMEAGVSNLEKIRSGLNKIFVVNIVSGLFLYIAKDQVLGTTIIFI